MTFFELYAFILWPIIAALLVIGFAFFITRNQRHAHHRH